VSRFDAADAIIWDTDRQVAEVATRCGVEGSVRRDETGGIITGWLGQLLVIMAVVAFVGFEVVTIAVTSVTLQDQAREVARAAASAYGQRERLTDAQEAAIAEATELGVEVASVGLEDDRIVATITTTADTLVLHRIGALETVTRPTASASVDWRL
jgi:hypothetical protein